MKDIGSMTLYKGKLGDVQLIMWDALPDCVDACTIFDTCPYEKMARKRIKCEMRRRYLESVMNSLEKGIEKKDEMTSLTVGLMLAPLFQHLISFKIFEHGLSHNLMSSKTKIHPVYKEIRATIKEINSLLRELGITASDKEKNYLDGNAEYYDEMIKNGSVVS